jgi:phytoene dehydrogenase-like protein
LNTTVTSLRSDGVTATVSAECDGVTQELTCTDVLANCAPSVLERLMGRESAAVITPPAAGAQIKVNMLLSRLPRLLDDQVDPADAFAGTFHINESYTQLQVAFDAANAGQLGALIPSEIYCHSLSDPSILGPELQQAGAQTLTVFALHAPHAIFEHDNARMREVALDAVLESLNSVLAEPIQHLLWRDDEGIPCIEVNTTVDIERALNIPTGNIFHTPLEWPFAEHADEVGTWGVETDIANVTICGSGARRGGGVSGIPGHNAAAYVLNRKG